MIRRDDGDGWLLITQSDHAALSGELAKHIGNERFGRVTEKVIIACGMHDAGWPMHDYLPTLNALQLPLDVFESPREISFPIWTASAEQAARVDPYVGLLVSLHSLALSALPVEMPTEFHASQMKERFENNKFQHRQIEMQEKLRTQLGMRTDIPLTLGLAEMGIDPREDQLIFDFRWLQAMDQISLAVCCTHVPFNHADVHPQPGQQHTSMRFAQQGDDLHIWPWPFDASEMACTIRGRRMQQKTWDSVESFHAAYNDAPIEEIQIRIMHGG